MKFLVTIILFGNITFNTYAVDFMLGKIVLKDGTEYIGLLKPPTNKWEEEVKYKASENSSIENVKSSLIDEITFNYKGQDHRLIYKEVWVPKNQNPKSEKDYKIKKAFWSIEVVSGYVTLYAQVGNWKFDNSGNLLMNLGSLEGSSDIYYYAQKEGLKKPAFVGYYSINMMGQMKTMITYVSHFIFDHTELVARVKNEEFTTKEIELIFRLYNQWKSD